MNIYRSRQPGVNTQSRLPRWCWRVVTAFALVLVQLPALALPAQAAPGSAPVVAPLAQSSTNLLTIKVVSARSEDRHPGGAVLKGDPITEYKYIINEDNTGTTVQRPNANTGALPVACTPNDANYPENCQWVSIAGVPGSSPIYTQGDQGDFAPDGDGNPTAGLNLPDGRYLISVLADGYKLEGAHFTVPLSSPGLVTVDLQPHPLPDATRRSDHQRRAGCPGRTRSGRLYR